MQPPRSHHAAFLFHLPFTQTTQSPFTSQYHISLLITLPPEFYPPLRRWWNVPNAPSPCMWAIKGLFLEAWMHNHPLVPMLLQPLYVSSHHSFFFFSISCIQKYMLMFLFIIVDRGSLLNSYLIWREKQLMKYDVHPILNIYSSLLSILYSYISLLLFTYIFYVLLLIPSLFLFQVQECSFQLTQPKRRRLLFLRYFLLFLFLLFLISPSSLTYFFCFLLFSFVFFRFLSFCFCFVSFFNFFLLTNFI